jgi:hypothetical protein
MRNPVKWIEPNLSKSIGSPHGATEFQWMAPEIGAEKLNLLNFEI